MTANDPAALVQQGLTLHQRGDLDAAEKRYRAALARAPRQGDANHLLGLLLMERERYAEAAQHIQQALAAQPGHPVLLNSMGEVVRRQGDFRAARPLFERALQASPRYPEAWHNLGKTLTAIGALPDAESALRRSLALAPGNPRANFDLGELLQKLKRLPEAVAYFERAAQLAPDWEPAWNTLGLALKNCGRLTEAIAVFSRLQAWAREPVSVSNYLLTLSYDPHTTPESLLAEHQRLAGHGLGVDHAMEAPRERRPLRRIGLVSGDLRNHAMRFFVEPLLRGCQETSVELYGYYNFPAEDALTQQLKGLFAGFRQVSELDDDALAQLIRDDAIDLLVDLSGHTAYNRLGTFLRRPAPLQVSWIGYLPSTGLGCFDARITDALALPPAMQAYYTEPLRYLSRCQWCYQPPTDAPLPQRAGKAGPFRFGGLHMPAKLNPEVLDLWARILAATPGSEILLMADGAEVVADALRGRLPAAPGQPERVQVRRSGSLAEFLAAHNEVDVILDAFPYAGGTTTLHALWMGVPVLTLAAHHAAGRGGASILGHLGLPEYICASKEAYLAKAVALAAKGPLGDGARQALRMKLAGSPLTEAAAFAADFLRLAESLGAPPAP